MPGRLKVNALYNYGCRHAGIPHETQENVVIMYGDVVTYLNGLSLKYQKQRPNHRELTQYYRFFLNSITFGLFVLCSIIFVLAGCLRTTPIHKIDKQLHPARDFAVNVQQVRLRMRALAEPLSAAIVESADRIMAGTADQTVRREALLFKIEAVPAMREALFRPNPYNAVLDSWVLTLQMSDYFENGRGKEVLGDAAPIAINTCRYLQSQIESVAASMTLSGKAADLKEFAEKWAHEHPIRHSIAGRESTVSLATEVDIQERFSSTEALDSIVVMLDDMGRRLDIYSAQMLNQARWEAELLTMDLGKDYQIEKAIPLAENAIQSATDIVEVANRLLPSLELALTTVASVPEVIRMERTIAIESLKKERIAALDHLTRERQAAIMELRELIIKERMALTNEMERIRRNVVDHTFLRLAQLTAAVLSILFIGIIVLMILARRMFGVRPANSSSNNKAKQTFS